MLATEIKKLMEEKPNVIKENEKRITENKFRDDCIELKEEALLELYERYKTNLRINCQNDMLFASNPALGYLMHETKNITIEIKNIIIKYFDKDDFIATHGFMGPYTQGFYLKFK